MIKLGKVSEETRSSKGVPIQESVNPATFRSL